MLRIERVLSNRGYCTRSEAARFLRDHDVTVGVTRLERPDARIDPRQVCIDGRPIEPPTLLVVLHKPTGYVCSRADPGRLVYELLPDRWLRRNPALTTVGRLDKDTSGVLLLSDDGQVVHRLTSPKRHVPRVYLATLRNPLSGREAETFAAGSLRLEPDDKPLLPAEMQQVDAHTARLTLHEGRYHQVRRMFAAVGNLVTALHREQFGAISVGALAPGEWRLLSDVSEVIPAS